MDQTGSDADYGFEESGEAGILTFGIACCTFAIAIVTAVAVGML